MVLRERLADAHRRPGLYGLTTFGEVTAFVTGMDAATEWNFLKGFRDWLHHKSGLGASLTWQVLVVQIAYPNKDNNFWHRAMHEESVEAVTTLFNELDLFLSHRESDPNGDLPDLN
ncbi:hypothetical protein G443_001563 [Actinoalloteichus cyanogriseus DSM 43889]|uniref:Uncharacterized protein n=1 Tax=Actinoalloteichus caeruleus DSM 43889 TaxID=1120930 RepID=A0ABT1JFT2_ACTCY|nr:hypothetical protein [Actinoalloteichus caeruleus DSM 43889]